MFRDDKKTFILPRNKVLSKKALFTNYFNIIVLGQLKPIM